MTALWPAIRDKQQYTLSHVKAFHTTLFTTMLKLDFVFFVVILIYRMKYILKIFALGYLFPSPVIEEVFKYLT